MKRNRNMFLAALIACAPAFADAANKAVTTVATTPAGDIPGWMSKPLSLADAMNTALTQNANVLKARRDLEAAYGIVVQTRAIVIPKLQSSASYGTVGEELNEQLPISTTRMPDQRWQTDLRVVQSIYEGGRMTSALRTARLTKEQALLDFQTVLTETLLSVRLGYYDVQSTRELIGVREASLVLLKRQLEDTTARHEAGTVPRFNVLRAEVELANARPPYIQARNAYRIAKQNLSNVLGYSVPRNILEDLPLQLSDPLRAADYVVKLEDALNQAMTQRTELGASEKARLLRKEGIITARAGYFPSVQLFAGHDAHNSSYNDDPTRSVDGWIGGVQFSWNIFDGFLTSGRVAEARARYERAVVDVEDLARQIELQVRTAYSNFIEAKEVLQSQRKVIEQAEEALRLAEGRYKAGAGTQLDVLSAQTALTDARSTLVQATRDYNAAEARLDRAIGKFSPVQDVKQPAPANP